MTIKKNSLETGTCECGKNLFSAGMRKMVANKKIPVQKRSILAASSKIDNRPICNDCTITEPILLVGRTRR